MTYTLIDAIAYLYPDAVVGIDYTVSRDEAGKPTAIDTWNRAVPEPDPATIDATYPVLDVVRAKQAKQAELVAAASEVMFGGYRSDALGAPHVYPSGLIDQINMQASVSESQLAGLPADWTTDFACVEPDNVNAVEWPWKPHTAAQIQQAGRDAKRFITAQRVQLRALLRELADPAIATVEAVQAIEWTTAAP